MKKIICHPTGAPPELIAAWVKLLSAEAPTRRGWPGSSQRVIASVPRFKQDAIDLLNCLKYDKMHLVGWSSGGFVALHAALLAPNRISKVTLFETPFGSSRDASLQARIQFLSVLLFKLFRSDRRVAKHFWKMVSERKSNYPAFELLDKQTQESLFKFAPYIFSELLSGTGEELLLELKHCIPQIEILIGSESSEWQFRCAKRLLNQLPNSKLTIVEGGNHLTPLVSPSNMQI